MPLPRGRLGGGACHEHARPQTSRTGQESRNSGAGSDVGPVCRARGAIYFGLILAFLSQFSGTPKTTDSSQQVFNYLSAHHARLQAAAVLMGFAMPAALLFLSGLFRALRQAEGGTARLALAALGGGILAAAAGATLLGLLLSVGVTAIISLQRQLLPRWFALASVVLALLSFAGAFTIGYATTATYVLSGVAIALDSVWIFLAACSCGEIRPWHCLERRLGSPHQHGRRGD